MYGILAYISDQERREIYQLENDNDIIEAINQVTIRVRFRLYKRLYRNNKKQH